MCAKIARAQVWTLTRADLQTTPVELKQISADAVTVQAADAGATAIPLDQFVSLSRTLEPKQNREWTLLLIGGDRYTGEPGPVVGETLTWTSPTLGTLAVPLTQLSQLSRGVAVTPPGNPPKQDVATLQSGDTVVGVFADCQGGKISIQTDAGSTDIPLTNLRALAFAPTGNPAATSTIPAFRLDLIDGTRATCKSVMLSSDRVTVVLESNQAKTVTVPLAAVVRIERINGAVSWLSSATPTEAIQQDYFGIGSNWPARFDTTLDGQPLRYQQQSFEHGISVHAYSKLSFKIDPTWTTFQTRYAVESTFRRPAPWADVDVRIFAGGKLVYEKLHVRSGTLSPPVIVDLNGVKTLTLNCDFGNNGDVQARLDWLQPALMRAPSPGESTGMTPAAKKS